VLLGIRTANQDGEASLTKRIPDNAQGRTVWLQAAETERASNVVEVEIQ
jgi:hypothetical protein